MKKTILLYFLFVLPFVLVSQMQFNKDFIPPAIDSVAFGDSVKQKDCTDKDLGDIFRSLFKKKNKERKPRTEKNFSFLILPNISSNPANGFLLGAGGNLAWYLGERESTRISLIGFSVAVTTEEQFISFIKSNIYTKDNKFFLQGDWRYYHYRLPTYGLGTNSPLDSDDFKGNSGWQGGITQDPAGSYPMLYDYFKFHEAVNLKLFENFYLGIGYHLDYYWNIKDEGLQTDSIPIALTPHFIYLNLYEFDKTDYILSGLGLNVMYDSRDNMINPYEGFFVNVNYRFNQTWLGSDQNSSTLWVEFRTYVGLSKKRASHLIGFWFFGDFQMTGHRPYLTLMASGEDQKARSGRGYIAGRFRGENMVYGEAEYRFPLTCSGVLGGVLFLNATTTTNLARGDEKFGADPVRLFQYVRPAFGFGLRFKINKYTRLNLNLDFGIGVQSNGFYFSGTETF